MAANKKKLIVNVVLMIFTLFTLITCVLAWFANQQQANIRSIDLMVERTDLNLENEITLIRFPCATKFAEYAEKYTADPEDATVKLFNAECAVSKTYVISGEGDLYVSVEKDKNGMLAYVCDSTATTDYFGELLPKLKSHMGSKAPSEWTHEDLQNALASINSRAVGDLNAEGNTEIQIVYWVEYDLIESKLNSDTYWDSGDLYTAHITFSG